MLKATTAIVTATLILTATVVSAQQRVNVRGTIKQISGDAIVITKKSGGEATVHLNVKSRISGTAKFTLADVKPGMKLGVTTVVRGSDIVAIDVRPIPKRAPDGLSPYDLAPNPTMTNGILEGDVAGTSGSNFITINYGKGKVKVLVPQGTPMSKAVDGSKADLKAGAAIYAATIKTNDGKLNAVRVQVGKNGLSPTQ